MGVVRCARVRREALSLVRDQLSALAHAAIEQYSATGYRQFVGSISPEEREDVEQRAAICEYDGSLPRDLAEGQAAKLVIGNRKGR